MNQDEIRTAGLWSCRALLIIGGIVLSLAGLKELASICGTAVFASFIWIED